MGWNVDLIVRCIGCDTDEGKEEATDGTGGRFVHANGERRIPRCAAALGSPGRAADSFRDDDNDKILCQGLSRKPSPIPLQEQSKTKERRSFPTPADGSVHSAVGVRDEA